MHNDHINVCSTTKHRLTFLLAFLLSINHSGAIKYQSTRANILEYKYVDGFRCKQFQSSTSHYAFEKILTLTRGGSSTTSVSKSDTRAAKSIQNEKKATSSQSNKKQGKFIDSKVQRIVSNKKVAPAPKEDPKILMLMRILFLSYYGSLGSLMPYLPVYYDSIGHGGQVIGFLGAVKPLTTFLVAPAWGILSDQTQQPFRILEVTFIVSLVGQLLVALRHDALFLTFMVFITALFNAPVKSLIDSLIMDQLHDPSSSYGRLRLWGQMGFGLGSSGVGMLLSKSHRNVAWHDVGARESVLELTSLWPSIFGQTLQFLDKLWQSMTGFKLLFFAHALLSVPTWICIQIFHHLDKTKENTEQQSADSIRKLNKKASSKNKKSAVNTLDGLRLLIQDADAMLFFFLVFVVGVSSGIIENFAYVRIREVGGTGKDMGLSRLVSSLAGAPMFWFSGPLTEALGADRVLVLSLMSYVVRFLIYAAMRNPFQGLLAEALRGVTFAAFWSTGTVYAHKVSPPGMHATMLLFLNAMYGGLGQSLGSIIGGKLQHQYGTVKTFLFSAAFDFVFVSLVVVYLSMQKGESSFKNPKPIQVKSSDNPKNATQPKE